VGVYGLTQMLTRIPIGIWSDAIGKRRAFVVAGMLVCGLAAAGLALAPNPSGLVVFRGVMGLAAATWVCSTVLFISYFPDTDPAVPLSIMSFMSAFGQVLATSAGGLIAEQWGWTAPFWVSMLLSMTAAVLLSLTPDDMTSRPASITPLSMLRIAKAPLLLLACGIGIILYFATYSTMYGFTTVYAERLGATRTQLGFLTTAGLLAYSVATISAPRILHRLGGERSTVLFGLAMVTLGIGPTALVSNVVVLALLQALVGGGRGLLYPLLMSISIKAVAAPDRASAMGIFQAAYALGMFIGPWVCGVVADNLGLPSVFVLCGGMMLVLLVLCIPLTTRRIFSQAFG
ncbi:MAG TPA: MFS transporter, partial [Anaerolineae bacterium]